MPRNRRRPVKAADPVVQNGPFTPQHPVKAAGVPPEDVKRFTPTTMTDRPKIKVDTGHTVLDAAVDAVSTQLAALQARPLAANYALLTVLSVVTRFYRLDHPDRVVFDEFHFGSFTNQYHSGNYFFDIHPPLGKLTLAAFGWVLGYDHTKCSYANINDPFAEDCGYAKLRFIAACFGAVLPMLVHAIAMLLGTSSSGALLAGMLVIFDMLNVTEARLVLTDSQLMFYSALALYTALRFWKRLDEARTIRSRRFVKHERNLWLLAVGMTCGAAISIKWTALAAPGMIAVESTFGIFGFVKRSLPFKDLVKVAVVAVAQYSLWFYFHFASLPYSGEGDAFMPYDFQRTLVNNTYYDPQAPQVSFWWIMPELNREMLSANARISTPHHWSSRWTQWLVNARGVLYWSLPSSDGATTSSIYLLGNPIVVWGCLAGVAAATLSAVFVLRYRGRWAPPAAVKSVLGLSESKEEDVAAKAQRAVATHRVLAFLLITYLLNLLPYIAVSRAAFIYHYMPGLLCAQLTTAVFLDWVAGSYSRQACQAFTCASALAFLYFSPWVYGLPLTPDGHAARRWMATWD